MTFYQSRFYNDQHMTSRQSALRTYLFFLKSNIPLMATIIVEQLYQIL
ncbi:hypothetical protein J8L86_11955 [Shewanella sp. MMG014]|nr:MULTISPECIES: hypothetical protein [unclassified Shewanella]MBQ4890564.1 hypothetical protein [Shewanella sp. MMG014]